MLKKKQNHLEKYIYHFNHLRRDHKLGGAPHKPILILAIIDCIRDGLIASNKVYITPELMSIFKENWKNYVITPHSPLFSLPFYHCRTEPFWELIANKGFEKIIKSKFALRTFKHLNEAVDYALIDSELFELLNCSESRNILKTALIEKYFPHIKRINDNGDDISKRIENVFFNEILDEKMEIEISQETEEEQVFIRGGLFKKLVPKIYEYSCCISGMRLISLHDISMIDACHIKPISQKGKDNITNGIALNPNLHRAFDRGLISVDTNYKVVISKYFEEDENNAYSLKRLSGVKLRLPFKKNFYPDIDLFNWHKENIFKG